MQWWVWIAVGLLMFLIELATPGGFVFIFFAIAGTLVGLLSYFGTTPQLWLQGILFSVISVGTLLLFRKPLLARIMNTTPKKAVDSMHGAVAIALEDIAIGKTAKVEFRGSPWIAHNVGTADLRANQRCIIVSVHDLTLSVRAE